VQSKDGADKLGYNRCRRSRSYAPFEYGDKEQIKEDVRNGGNDKVVKRVSAVTDCVKDSRCYIIHKGSKHAVKIRSEVENGIGEHVGGGAHPAQHVGREDNAHNRQNHTAHKAEGDVRMYGAAHILLVLGAEEFCNYNARAHGNTVKQSHDHKDKIAGGAYSGKGLLIYEISYDQSVCGVVKLLEQITEKNRESKGKEPLPYGPLQKASACPCAF